ncbi:hypothetical protein HDU98_007515 [Podochytrium sp. JEL0797]|nr:hypothetical protein HDU98_007515 [Podochytrium sp. JEL0797]
MAGGQAPSSAPIKYSVFAIPQSILSQIATQSEADSSLDAVVETSVAEVADVADVESDTLSGCSLCGVAAFESVESQHTHFRSAWHVANLQRRRRKRDALGFDDFALRGDGDESSSDEDEAQLSDEDVDEDKVATKGKPKVAFRFGENKQLAVFKALLLPQKTAPVAATLVKELALLQCSLRANQVSPPVWTLLMFSAGHFAAAVVAATAEPAPTLLVHKTFHRYTTRRKQGGAQSASDNAKGKANSAGSNLRRHNEMMLIQDIQALLTDWEPYLKASTRIFVRCPPRNARKIVYFNPTLLSSSDPRVRSFPFITNRPTIPELTRAFTELTTVTITDYIPAPNPTPKPPTSLLDSLSLSSTPPATASPKQAPKLLPPPEPFPKLLDFCKRNKLDLVRRDLAAHSDSPTSLAALINTHLEPRHGTTLLHVASSSGAHDVVAYLLANGADPTIRGGGLKVEGDEDAPDSSSSVSAKPVPPAYAVAETKEVRDAFRRAFAADTSSKFDWITDALVPSPLTKELEDQQKEKEREKKRKQKLKQKESLDAKRKEAEEKRGVEEARIRQVEEERAEAARKASVVGKLGKSARDAIGMTPERRMQLDREKRALAAEARFRAQQNKCSNCAKVLTPASTFEKFQYKYCSMDCVRNQIVLHN